MENNDLSSLLSGVMSNPEVMSKLSGILSDPEAMKTISGAVSGAAGKNEEKQGDNLKYPSLYGDSTVTFILLQKLFQGRPCAGVYRYKAGGSGHR